MLLHSIFKYHVSNSDILQPYSIDWLCEWSQVGNTHPI